VIRRHSRPRVPHDEWLETPRGSGSNCARGATDLNLPEADDLLAKEELAAKIIAEIQRQRMTQIQAAAILGIDQPKISALKQLNVA
jgi:predicted XRE-type DNA-binding protein